MKKICLFLKSSILVVLMTFMFSNFAHSQLVTIGTGTVVNTGTTYPAPYGNWYWGAHHQFLIPAAEITAAGAGNGFIQSVAFNVSSVYGTGLSNFEIKIGSTALTSLSTWQTGLTSVFLAPSYTETAGWNTHVFSAPFTWDGVSNIIIDVCFNNSSYTNNAIVYQTATSYVSTLEYNTDQAGMCAMTYVNTFLQRPNMQLDILPAVQSNENLGMSSWDSPTPNLGLGLTATTPITVTYKNWGLATQNIYTLSYSIDNGATFVTETVTAPILPDASLSYTFTQTADFSAMGGYNCIAAVHLAGDSITYNDTIAEIMILSIATVTNYPYFDNFENGNFWTAGGASSSWQFGTPAGSTINSPYSPSNCWATNLTGFHNSYEDSWVESILFDFTNLTMPVFDFKYWVNAQGLYYDGAKVQYTVDGGTTWLQLGSEFGDPSLDPNGTNWYNGMSIAGLGYVNGWTDNSSGWMSGKYIMTALAGEPSVKFRVCFGSDASIQNDGFAFDDVMIYQLPDDDMSVMEFITSAGCIGATGQLPITLKLKNTGINSQSLFSVSYSIDGGVSFTTESISLIAPLAQGDELLYTFTALAPFSSQGTYYCIGEVNLIGDQNSYNDSIFLNVTIVGYPFAEDFETFAPLQTTNSCTGSTLGAVANGWIQDPADQGEWRADVGGTGSTNTGPSMDYNPGTSSGVYLYTETSGCYSSTINLISPCFDFSSGAYELEFAYHMWGSTMGTLSVDVLMDTVWILDVWTMSGDQGNVWNVATVNLATYNGSNVQLRFRGVTGTNYYSDMAIDDIELIPLLPDDAGITSVYSLESVCEGLNDVAVTVANLGTNVIDSVIINWVVNGVVQTPYYYNTPLALGAVDSVLLGNYTFVGGVNYDVLCFTTMPNGVADNVPGNDSTNLMGFQTAFSGTYTIGATGDYPDFATAVNILNVMGVCGPVVFNVEAGTYNEQVTIGEINGASAANTITFQSLSGDSTDVIVNYAATGTIDNWVWRLDGSDYVTIQNMTLQSTTTTNYGRVIEFISGASNNLISNNVIQSVSITSSYAAGIYSYNTLDTNNTISYNKILNGYYGIYWYGNSSSNLEIGNKIIGNEVLGFYYYGIFSYYQDAIIISENYVENSTASGSMYGIYCYYNDNGVQITKNNVYVHGTATHYGIRAYYCDGNATDHVLIANNFVSQSGGTASVYGMYIYNSIAVDVFNNSVNVTGGSTTAGRGMYIGGSSSYYPFSFKNNCVVNTGGGYAVEFTTTSVTGFVSEMDYNNFYSSGMYIAKWGNFYATDIPMLQGFNLMDANSISVDPVYTSLSNLHTFNPAMNGTGVFIAEVPDDIDGEMRDTLTPDIGADEFTPAPIDIGVVGLLNPLPEMCYDSAQLVSVLVQNFGLDTIHFSIDTLFIEASVGGTNPVTFPTTEVNVGTLAPGASLEIVLSVAYDMSVNGTYTFDAYTILSNDGNMINDAMGSVVINVFGINTLPYAEDFETFTSGNPGTIGNGWSRNPVSGMAWMPDMGGTSSSATGPNIDHTTGSTSGIYVYMETSSGTTGDSAFFMPPCASIASKQLSFWYHMYGATMGTLGVQEFVNGGWSTLWSLTGQQMTAGTDPWVEAIVLFSPTANTFRFYGVRGTSYSGDMAIDDILIIQPLPNDASVEIAYTFGKLPLPNGTPTQVSALIKNWGFNPQTNLDVTLSLTGDNTFTDVFTIANLAPYADTLIYFNVYSPTVIGNNTVSVTVPADDNLTNNSWQYAQITNADTYNHCDTSGATNSLGWTAGNEGIFLSKYYISGVKTIEFVNVFIGDNNTVGQSLYAVVVDTGGVIIGESAPIIIAATDTGDYVSFPILIPSLANVANVDVYVGLAATNSVNGVAYYALGLQEEDPARGGAFYYSGMTGGSFTELNDYGRYMIEAVLGDPPPIEGNLVGFLTPEGGCGLTTTESVTIQIQNAGTDTISGGLSATYGLVGGPFFTENVPGIIYPGNIIAFTFAQTIDLFVNADSTFEFIAWIDLTGDPIQLNDTSWYSVESLNVPDDPIAVNDTVPYGTAALLSAIASDSLFWFDVPTGGTYISLGSTYPTGVLYDTISYWVEAGSAGGSSLAISEVDLGAPDFIEIQNISGGVFDATGWFVVVSDSYTIINDPNPITWPLDLFLPGEVKYRTDNSTMNYWGNNLFFNPGAYPSFTGWCLLVNDIGEIVDAVFWGWPAASIATFNNTVNGFNLTITDEWLGDGIQNYPLNNLERITYDNDDLTDWINQATNTMGIANPNLQLVAAGNGCTSNRVEVMGIVEGIPDYDAGVTVITEPFTGLLLGNEAVTIEVLNYGVLPISNFDVAYILDGQAPVVETVTANLNSGDSYIYTFATLADLSAFGTYDFIAYPMLSADTIAVNDTAYATVENLPLQYCASNATANTYEEIINVDLSNLSNYSGPSNGAMYTDFTLLPAVQLAPGMTYPVSITTDFFTYTTQYSCWVKVYIDWNRDAVYDE
ncbi:MAG: hypothetical protein HN347_04280, partial [Bacteroidetes bacterium]|nr:hypothetical protein [Bacteroidota bacterium]